MSKLIKIQKYIEKDKESSIIKMLKDKDKEVRIAAIDGLSKIGKDDSCNELVPLLHDDDPDIRTHAAKTLGIIGSDHTATHIRYRLEHETDDTVKAALSEALDELKKYEKL